MIHAVIPTLNSAIMSSDNSRGRIGRVRNSRFFLCVLSAISVVAFTASCAHLPASGLDRAADARAVEDLYRSGIAAFNRHNLEEFTAQFADDIEMYTPTGWVKGRPAVIHRFRDTFTQFPRVQMIVDSLAVRVVSHGVATVAFSWRVHPMGQGPAFHGVGSGVYVLRRDKWEEVLEHETVTRVDAALQQHP